MTQVRKTATYRVVTDSGGDRIFRFYCDFSGELCCVSKPIRADTEEAALEIAWEQEGKWECNFCPKCGKYVSSAMFNVNAGLRAVGGRVPFVLPSLRRTAPGIGHLLLPHLRGEAAGGRHRRKGESQMTDYDLRTGKALRRVVLLEYGCGPDTLRRRKICPSCGRANSADRTDCTDCGARLPEMTLYDLYRSRHRCCPGCGVAVTNVARYCPECGARLPKGTARREAAV